MPSLGVRRLRRAADETIRALRSSGRLEACDSLLVALVRSVAERADGDGPDACKYARLLANLDARLRTLGAPESDGFAELLRMAAGPVDGP